MTAADTQSLIDSLKDVNVLPLWLQMERLNPPTPMPKTRPFIWHYDDLRPYLISAGNLITEQQAERRVLMLVNPEKPAPYTTDTLYAGLQLVMPHETAPAHRHSAFAVRFIIEGQGGFTAVQGQRVPMKQRDVIITPAWNWHDHGKKGADEEGGDDEPMIWLDGLDLPQFMHYPVHFNEHFSKSRYPAEDMSDSSIVFPWSKMQPLLDNQPGQWASVPYLKVDGSELSRTIGACADRLDPNAESPVVRETASSVYHVIEGTGCTEINGQKVGWKQGDTFCIPSWAKFQHFSDGQKVYLYRLHDKPMLRSLGFYRIEGQSDEEIRQQSNMGQTNYER